MIDMHLKLAKGISYSQLYPNGADNIDELTDGLPTCESVQWLSFIVHRKTNLDISECDYNIMGHLMFELDKELQQRILKFMEQGIDWNDQYIEVPAMLETINLLLTKQNDKRQELSAKEKSRLFKAYLIECDNNLINKVPFNLDHYKADDMLRYYMPFTLKFNSIMVSKNVTMELVKSKLFLVDFAKSDKEFDTYINAFMSYLGCKNASEYMWYVFDISNQLFLYRPLTNNIDIRLGHNAVLKNILDIMSVNLSTSGDVPNIQEKPLYKVDENVYCILFFKFFIDKFFHSLIFDLAHAIESKGLINTAKTPAYIQLKQKIGQKFTEQFLFYTILNRTLVDEGFHKFTGTELEKVFDQGMPDYIAFKSNKVFVFEFKDIQMKSDVRQCQDYDKIINFVDHSLIASESGKPKGITQLANVIEKHLNKALDSWNINGKLQIYPIIVYTDSCFDIEGFNYYLNNKFKIVMSEKKVNTDWEVKDLVMVNLDSLMMFERAFKDRKLDLDTLLDEYSVYQNSDPVYKVVPFNKYLFQRGKAIGYFFKTPPIAMDTIKKLQEASRNISSN